MTRRRKKNARLEHVLTRLRELAPGYALARIGDNGPVFIRTEPVLEPTKEKEYVSPI